MLVKMSDDGAKTMSPEISTVEILDQSGAREKSRLSKEHVIIAVTCAVVACAVIAGIVVGGVKLFLDSTDDIVKKTFEFADKDSDKTVEEDVDSDVTENVVQYHAKADGRQMWVLNDFNRELQLIKIQEAPGFVCYVTPLNRSDTALPEQVGNATLPTGELETSERKFEAAETAIKEKSMLGPKGEKLCDSFNVYWMTENCEASTDSKSPGERKRRRACYRYRCYYRYYCRYANGKRYCQWKRVCYKVAYRC